MKVVIFIIIVFIMSCSYSDNEMIGIYTPSNYKNTYDTIELSSNNVYYRRIYDGNKKLVLKTKGTWIVDKDILEFDRPYFWNLDDDLAAITYALGFAVITYNASNDKYVSSGMIQEVQRLYPSVWTSQNYRI